MHQTIAPFPPDAGIAASQSSERTPVRGRLIRLAATTMPMAALLAACSSSQPPADSATQAAAQESVQVAPAWQAERVKYMECVQVKVDDGVSSKAVPADVAGGALSACQDQLKVMHDAFQSYLMAGMSSAHGRSSAKQAADRVTTDTCETARVYLTRYVEVERYKAGQR